jgi:hypothetical protein
MKRFSPILLACVLAIPAYAQDAKTNAAPELKKTATAGPAVTTPDIQTPGLSFPVSAGVVSAPFVVTNGYLYQPAPQTGVTEGGKAIYSFTITNAGNYVIHAVVNAPAMESNSFYLNIDGPPEDPTMIWDIDVTTGFAERVVSWRGDGSDTDDQFVPKRFNLASGMHKLVIHGREPDVQLKTISILPAVAN